MTFGPRKLGAVLVVVAVTVASVVVGYFFGVSGLLGALIAVSVLSALGTGWFIAESERKMMRRLEALEQKTSSGSRAAPADQPVQQDQGLPPEQVEQLLTAIHLRLVRTEAVCQAGLDELRHELEEIRRQRV